MKTLQSLNLNDIFTYVKNLLNVQSKTNVQLNIVPNNCLVAAVFSTKLRIDKFTF